MATRTLTRYSDLTIKEIKTRLFEFLIVRPRDENSYWRVKVRKLYVGWK